MSIFDSPLIRDQITKCCIMNKIITDDDYGGYETTWSDGAKFDAVITVNSSVEAAIAGIASQATYYGVKVKRETPLEYHTVFKRISDGKLFRISNSEGLHSPSFSALDMKQLQAEDFSFTDDDSEEEDDG